MVAIPACLVGLGEEFRYFLCVHPHHHSYLHQQVMDDAFPLPDAQTTPKWTSCHDVFVHYQHKYIPPQPTILSHNSNVLLSPITENLLELLTNRYDKETIVSGSLYQT